MLYIRKRLHYLAVNLMSSLEGFLKDDCFSKASSLTFYTLLSIVPILAVAFGIAKGFGFESYLKSEIQNRIEQKEISQQLIAFSYNALEQTHVGVIASIGLLALFWTSIQLLSKIEHALNEIWEVKIQRSYGRQFSDYLAIIVLCPIFFVLSSSLSIYAITLLDEFSHQNLLIKAASPYFLYMIRLMPFVLNWILFSLIYIVLPNITVNWSTAIFGGILAGTLYQIVNWIYIQFQIGVANYSAIYGSFAALPLFLVWVNVSWQIVLLGAEIAYHFENAVGSHSAGSTKSTPKRHLAVAVCAHCCATFLQGQKPSTIQQIANDIGASPRVIRYIASELFEANLLAKNQEGGFLPAKNPRDMSIKDVLDIFEETRYATISRPCGDYYENCLLQFESAVRHSKDNLSLADLSLGRQENESL